MRVFGIRFFLLLLLSLAITASTSAQQRGALSITPKQSEAVGAADAPRIQLYAGTKALVIGINRYDAGWPKLSNAVPDAEAVAQALQARGYAVTLKKDLKSDDLDRTLKDFFVNEGADEQTGLMLWFAGHGHTMNGEGYLVPADAPGASTDRAFRSKAISLRRFGEYMREAKSKHVLAIFDSCFAGTVFDVARSTPPAAVTNATALPVRQFISSGDANQEVSDNGLFRKLFLDALTGLEPNADANRDGYITGTELGLFLGDKVTNLTQTRQTPRYGKLAAYGLDRGDYVFGVGPPSTTTTVAAAPDPNATTRAQPAPAVAATPVTSPPAKAPEPKTALATPQPPPPPAAPATAAPSAPTATSANARSAPGTVFRDCQACPEMVVIPVGEFMMGSDANQREQPVHKVTIARPFAVGRFEITQENWDACLADGGCGDYEPWGAGKKHGGKLPVADVSFNDAKVFLAWLTKKSGKIYRLLSEAEWEYAARAGTTTRFPWGRDIDAGKANCRDCGSPFNGKVAPVGSFPPNPFGLYDMHGNVEEWVEDCRMDWYGADPGRYAAAPTDGSARIDDGTCKYWGGQRMARGGSANDAAMESRSSARIGHPPVNRFWTRGLRVARALE